MVKSFYQTQLVIESLALGHDLTHLVIDQFFGQFLHYHPNIVDAHFLFESIVIFFQGGAVSHQLFFLDHHHRTLIQLMESILEYVEFLDLCFVKIPQPMDLYL